MGKDSPGGLLLSPHLIMGGDLNFTMNTSEIWGTRVVIDPLATYFKHLFGSVGLLDIAPSLAGPTWRNGRVGEHGINKRLE